MSRPRGANCPVLRQQRGFLDRVISSSLSGPLDKKRRSRIAWMEQSGDKESAQAQDHHPQTGTITGGNKEKADDKTRESLSEKACLVHDLVSTAQMQVDASDTNSRCNEGKAESVPRVFFSVEPEAVLNKHPWAGGYGKPARAILPDRLVSSFHHSRNGAGDLLNRATLPRKLTRRLSNQMEGPLGWTSIRRQQPKPGRVKQELNQRREYDQVRNHRSVSACPHWLQKWRK
jgi:hypothetical protein